MVGADPRAPRSEIVPIGVVLGRAQRVHNFLPGGGPPVPATVKVRCKAHLTASAEYRGGSFAWPVRQMLSVVCAAPVGGGVNPGTVPRKLRCRIGPPGTGRLVGRPGAPSAGGCSSPTWFMRIPLSWRPLALHDLAYETNFSNQAEQSICLCRDEDAAEPEQPDAEARPRLDGAKPPLMLIHRTMTGGATG